MTANPRVGDSPFGVPGAVRFGLGPGWWDDLAAGIAGQCGAAGAFAGSGLCARDLRALTVVVPRGAHVALLQAALHRVRGGAAGFAPCIVPEGDWLGEVDGGALAQRAEVFEALRASAWAREAFGTQGQVLWPLAREACALGDALTLAAAGDAAAFEGRLAQAVGAHFDARAREACDAQSRLVLSLWRAGQHEGRGAGAVLAGLAGRASRARGPLLWLAPYGAQPWQRALCEAWERASGAAARMVEGDAAALARARPLLAAAWPELAGEDRESEGEGECEGECEGESAARPPPLLARAQCVPKHESVPVRVVAVCGLEDEAVLAADWVREQLRAGVGSIAIVALDRAAARRTRALLERAAILVRDESGWRLSTTSAASALMGWLEVLQSRFAPARFARWLRSPFVLAGEPGRDELRQAVSRLAREGGAPAGGSLVARYGARLGEEGRALLRNIERVAQPRSGREPAGQQLDALDRALRALGVRAALAQDAVGRTVVDELDRMREQLADSPLRIDAAELRALLADRFEETNAADASISSPVVMTSLAGTRLRPFDAAILLGAGEEHLGAKSRAGALLPDGVCRALGLRSRGQDAREQLLDLALLLAGVPRVWASWRQWRDGEPAALSPVLDRLRLLCEAGGMGSIVVAPERAARTVAWEGTQRPAPVLHAAAPEAYPVQAAQQLVDCPYRFFARALLGLRERERPASAQAPRDFGVLIHEIAAALRGQIERAARDGRPGVQAADAPQWRERALALVVQRCEPLLAERPERIAFRERLRLVVPDLVDWMLAQRGQGWERGESEVECAIDLAGAARLRGRIDLVERNVDGRVRIIDFKTRDPRQLRRDVAVEGEDVQLPLYVAMLARARGETVQAASYVSVRPRGAEGARVAKVMHEIAVPGEPVAQVGERALARFEADLARVAAGEPLPAQGDEESCGRCELHGLCRREHWEAR